MEPRIQRWMATETFRWKQSCNPRWLRGESLRRRMDSVGERCHWLPLQSDGVSKSRTIPCWNRLLRPEWWISASPQYGSRQLFVAYPGSRFDVYTRRRFQHGRPQDSDPLYRELDVRIREEAGRKLGAR